MFVSEIIKNAEERGEAIGHFNISNLEMLKAVVSVAKKMNKPVFVGVSEGERDFIGLRQTRALVDSYKPELKIFLNADHTYSLERVKEAAREGFDAIIFDGAGISHEDNIKKTKEAVDIVKKINPNILVEAEIGYIGKSSKMLESLPEGAAISIEDLPTAEEAREFVEKTGVDLLAPAVGNLHGMLKNAPNPNLQIERIKEIREAAGVPLVLHGGSGVSDEDFKAAIKAGVSIIHISTEMRVAWRKGLEEALKEKPDELSPYRILPEAVKNVERVIEKRLILFSGQDN